MRCLLPASDIIRFHRAVFGPLFCSLASIQPLITKYYTTFLSYKHHLNQNLTRQIQEHQDLCVVQSAYKSNDLILGELTSDELILKTTLYLACQCITNQVLLLTVQRRFDCCHIDRDSKTTITRSELVDEI